MSSPPPASTYGTSPFRHGSFLLLQDEAPLAPKGHGALASLIKSRSAMSAHHPPASRDEEEANGADRRLDDDQSRRDERRLSALLNGPQMRSMRLIGNSNPRYQWEKYWKTEDQLQGMKRKMFV